MPRFIPTPPGSVAEFNHIWKTWLLNLFNGVVQKDRTGNVTVGYTTDIEADTFSATLVPDLTLEHLKTMTVTSNFTVNEPTQTGHCEYYLEIDSGGPYTLTLGTGVDFVGFIPSLAASSKYIMNVRRYGVAKTVIQVVFVDET